MTNTSTTASVDNLDRAVLYQDWMTAASIASQIARTSDDWNVREIHASLANTYALLAQADEARRANELTEESHRRESHQLEALNGAVAAIANSVREMSVPR